MCKIVINGQEQQRAVATYDKKHFNCSIGFIYTHRGFKCTSGPGKVCKPVQGTFCTECEVEGCNKFC